MISQLIVERKEKIGQNDKAIAVKWRYQFSFYLAYFAIKRTFSNLTLFSLLTIHLLMVYKGFEYISSLRQTKTIFGHRNITDTMNARKRLCIIVIDFTTDFFYIILSYTIIRNIFIHLYKLNMIKKFFMLLILIVPFHLLGAIEPPKDSKRLKIAAHVSIITTLFIIKLCILNRWCGFYSLNNQYFLYVILYIMDRFSIELGYSYKALCRYKLANYQNIKIIFVFGLITCNFICLNSYGMCNPNAVVNIYKEYLNSFGW